MWENLIWGKACENPVGLSMNERHKETVEYTWVNICWMLH